MAESSMTRIRRRVGYGLSGLATVGAIWVFTPGLPVWWGPRASAKEIAAGRELFEHEWQPFDEKARGDGLGPVFNGRSCVECHFQGGVGGGGDNGHNVLAFEAHPTRDRPEVAGGLVHKFAVASHLLENTQALHAIFPVIPDGIRFSGGCQILTRDFDPIRTESVNSTALFGAGWIDRIPGKTIAHYKWKESVAAIGRELQADFSGITPGRYRILDDGRIGKFGWKAQFATLKDFVAAACANEIGLGNPEMSQAKPLAEAGYPEVDPDLDRSQFRSLVAFVDTLPRPVVLLPESPHLRASAERGKALFSSIGCAVCHIPSVGGIEGIYSDFLLHRLEDRQNGGGSYGAEETPEVPLPHEHPKPDEWKTPPLWGVADSAPYFHDGGSPTLKAAILRHEGGAKSVTQAYRALSAEDQAAVLAFLKTLKAPNSGGEASGSLASAARP